MFSQLAQCFIKKRWKFSNKSMEFISSLNIGGSILWSLLDCSRLGKSLNVSNRSHCLVEFQFPAWNFKLHKTES